MDDASNGVRIKFKLRKVDGGDGGNRGDHMVNDDNNNNPTTCKICCKEFSSVHALFGHMRCHPPETRLQTPTPTAVNGGNCTSSSSSSAVVDCSTSLPTWTLTNRRGRKRPSASAASTSNAPLGGCNDYVLNAKKKKIDNVDNAIDVDTRAEPAIISSSKRKLHFETDEPCNTDRVSSSNENSEKKKKMMDFDLNELPPMEEEDDGIDGSCFPHV